VAKIGKNLDYVEAKTLESSGFLTFLI